ncbi:hypothetical protein like AT3G24255 [Hibiscus trionum]|uniref:Reverse transcriptase zinc-binding domain-containing protein n=1 Tax=Hibiscus trionum TaxID=183268 RepID=A0A9W7J7U7_HIBTR|nr:hypothetical protein like AT3G24255 [Hibiscus trionum]
MRIIRDILSKFCLWSGHRVSVAKTQICFSKNITADLRDYIAQEFGFTVVSDLGKYLGVPLLHSRVTKATYAYLLDMVQKRLLGWAAKALSLVGRVTLAKAVLQAIPVYTMQSTWLPKGLCNDIERLIRRFVWGGSHSTSAVPLLNWEIMKQPMDRGGLGFRDMGKQNSAFLMKLGFQLICDEGSLWVKILKAKYRWIGVMPLHLRRMRCSRVWKGLSSIWNEVRRGICWNVRDGLLTDFWQDTWLDGEGPLAAACLQPLDMRPTSVAGMVTATGEWDWPVLAHLLPERVLLKIAAVPPPNVSLGDDNPAWRWEMSRRFSTKSAYQALLPNQGEADRSIWKLIWVLNVPKRVQTFLWLMAHERLLTNMERVRRHIATSPICSLCGVAEEDIDHVLRKCTRVEEVWMNLVNVQDRNMFRVAPFREWMLGNLTSNAVGMHRNKP